jgi:lysophospholipid acyltransferase (LPLAT)-like uncharacterized protein
VTLSQKNLALCVQNPIEILRDGNAAGLGGGSGMLRLLSVFLFILMWLVRYYSQTGRRSYQNEHLSQHTVLYALWGMRFVLHVHVGADIHCAEVLAIISEL